MKEDSIAKFAEEIEEHLRIIRQILRKPLETQIAREGLTAATECHSRIVRL